MGSSKVQAANGHTAYVWTHENRVSSDAQIREAPLDGLAPDAKEPQGQYARVDGQTSLGGIFKWAPFLEGQTVTRDPFDQTELYHALDTLCRRLMKLGINVEQILGGKHNGKTHPITAHANKVADLNAWYSPNDDELTFGRGDERWHLASDADVGVHEAGHLFLDHIHPGFGGWYGGEGGAIHEGFGDILAALIYDDPEMSEDFAVAIGRPPSKTDGLRNVNNSLSLKDVSEEVHDRGRVYAGFFWSLRQKIGLPGKEGADLLLKLLFNHAAHYTTRRPKPEDFVHAVQRGAVSLSRSQVLPIPIDRLLRLIEDEGKARGLLEKPTSEIRTGLAYNMEETYRNFGGPGTIRFERVTQIPYQGGTQERYDQLYRTQNHGWVPVLARGIFVEKPGGSMIPNIHTRDARPMKDGEVDEKITVSRQEARGLAEKFLTTEWSKQQLALQRMKTPPRTETVFLKKRALQMEEMILQASLQTLRAQAPSDTYAILPDGKKLVHHFSLGLSDLYVDAQTGAILFVRRVYT